MPVTELASLLILPPYTTTSPEITSFFTSVSRLQSAWSGYPLFYFVDSEPTDKGEQVLYLVSGWESAEKHEEWIASDANQGLLKVAGEKAFLGVKGLVHLGIEIDGRAVEALEGSVGGLLKEGGEDNDGLVEGEVKEGPGVIWSAEGTDVEGKKEGVWRLVLFKDEEALEGAGKQGWRIMKRVHI